MSIHRTIVALAVAVSVAGSGVALRASHDAPPPAAAAGESKAAADCSSIEQQLERDKEAVRRQQKSIEQANNDLEEWDKANKAALKDAAKDAAKLALGRLVKVLESKQELLRGLQDRIRTNMFRKMGSKDAQYLANVQNHLQRALREYERAKLQIDLGKILSTGLDAESIWSMVNNTITGVAHAEAAIDTTVNAAIKDPELSSFFEADHAGSEFAQSFAEMALTGAGLGPYVDVASFVVNSAYNAVKWNESRKQILQRYKLSEDDLKAVDALKTQIEDTVERLQTCRANAEQSNAQAKKAAPPAKNSGSSAGPAIAILGGLAAAGGVGAYEYQKYLQQQNEASGGTSSSSGLKSGQCDGTSPVNACRSCTCGSSNGDCTYASQCGGGACWTGNPPAPFCSR